MKLKFPQRLHAVTAGFLICSALTSETYALELADCVYPGNVPTYSAPDIQFLPDGETYAMLSADGKRISTYDCKTASETGVIMDVDNTRENKIGRIESYTISPDGSKILVKTESSPIYRRSTSGKYYFYEIRSRLLKKLSDNHPRQQSPLFSPDGRMVAFVDSNNIYIKKLDYGTEVAVTTDGAKNSIINGVPDWTYEEEFGETCSMIWTADNSTLCYLKYDEKNVPLYNLPIYEGACSPRKEYALYPGTLSYKYPVAGQPNSRLTLHSYDIETRKNKTITLANGNYEYIPRIFSTPESDKMLAVTLNRDQNRMEIYAVNPKSTLSSSIYVDQAQNAWIEPDAYEALRIMPQSFILSSSRSGYRHYYEYSYSGALIRQITSGDYDVTALSGYDADSQTYYMQSCRNGAVNRTLSSIDRKGQIKDISPAQGFASAIFSPNAKYYLESYSSLSQAPSYILKSAKGKEIKNFGDNTAYAQQYASLPRQELSTVEVNGVKLNVILVKPANMSPGKKYPLIINQYSGPGSQEVLDRWSPDWTRYFATQGYAVATIDPHGTGGRGRAFMDAVYCKLGITETSDLVAAAKALAATDWIDADRIGIYGWSYGGYEALMCATAPQSPFKATVAVAPVTDWRYYDTAYTERYMRTPQQNESGYDASAPLNRIDNLQGNLLMMWGTLDDNVHPANSLEFISRMQMHGKYPQILVFPNQNHSINGCGLREAVYRRMLDFLNTNM